MYVPQAAEDSCKIVPDSNRSAFQTIGIGSSTFRDVRKLEASFLADDAFEEMEERQAIARSLGGHPNGIGLSFFVGERISLGTVNVYFVLSVETDALDVVPRRTGSRSDGEGGSLVCFVLQEVIRRFRLSFSEDAGVVDYSIYRQANEIARVSAEHLLNEVLGASGFNHGLLFDQISALPYEGRAGVGRIVIKSRQHVGNETSLLALERAVDVKDVKAVRKLLEVSGEAAELLMYDDRIYGARVTEDSSSASEDLTALNFSGHGAWDLYDRGRLLFSSRDGFRRLPARASLDENELREKIDWLIPGADTNKLRSLARAAALHSHGAMLIISADAESEAERLYPQAWKVSPVPISDVLLTRLTSMDGGILVDGTGKCHAIGVILDGRAGEDELPTRGSRFNNAARYLATPEDCSGRLPRAVVLVFSADGGVDILPKIHPTIPRAHVSLVVDNLVDALGDAALESEEVWRRLELVENMRFYLSQSQCDEVNLACQEFEALFPDDAQFRRRGRLFKPNPRMDGQRFFLD
ncbi:hypothetical protein ABT346_13385 [Micromonospora peucetia]|uniref:hypothetical protein n=1 Tax=Micromonospora peucetia TaxID=47871 RepID=UPI0033339DE5